VALCKKFFTALRAELCFERHFILTISLREIVKMKCLSEEYSAAAGGKRLITEPQMIMGLCKKSFHGASRQI
jgi:hypothetical protein